MTGDQVAEGALGPGFVAFGARVKSLRGALSLRGLANELGVSHGYLSGIENGKIKPGLPLVRQLEAKFGAEGALLSAYAELLDEWDARKRAMARRRREIARREHSRASEEARSARPELTDGTNTQSGRYAVPATSLERRAADRSLVEARDTNRREVLKFAGGGLLAAGAIRARNLLRWAEAPSVGSLTLDDLEESVAWLSEQALALPIVKRLEIADKHATEVADLLLDGRHSGSQRARLELLTGQLAYLQGRWVAFGLGNPRVAQAHFRLARHYGTQLDHHVLLASVADSESTLAFYRGQFEKGLYLAQQAHQWETPYSAARTLTSKAKAYAGMGPAYRKEMHDAIKQAERLLPDVLVFEPGAALPYGPEMFLYHAGTAYMRAGDEPAEEFARNAISEYEALEAQGHPRADHPNLGSARLNLAITLAQRQHPDPEEAARLALPAVTKPREFHAAQTKRRLDELMILLGASAWRTLPKVKELAEQATHYKPLALPAPRAR